VPPLRHSRYHENRRNGTVPGEPAPARFSGQASSASADDCQFAFLIGRTMAPPRS